MRSDNKVRPSAKDRDKVRSKTKTKEETFSTIMRQRPLRDESLYLSDASFDSEAAKLTLR